MVSRFELIWPSIREIVSAYFVKENKFNPCFLFLDCVTILRLYSIQMSCVKCNWILEGFFFNKKNAFGVDKILLTFYTSKKHTGLPKKRNWKFRSQENHLFEYWKMSILKQAKTRNNPVLVPSHYMNEQTF